MTSECRNLLSHIDSTEIKFYEVAARARSGFTGDFKDPQPRPHLEVFVDQEDEQCLTVRMRLVWNTDAMDMRADAGVVFKWTQSREIEDDLLKEFVESVGIPYVYPYIRVSLDDLAKKFGLAGSGIPLLRMDQVALEPVDT